MPATKVSLGRQTDLNASSQKITSLADPTAAQDAATKAYVDAVAIGIDWKPSVRAATTANGALATAFANTQVIDGVTLATGDRILIKDQTAGAENGLYTVNASGAPTRSTDADTATEVTGGLAVFVEEGTINSDTGWVLTNNGTITLGTTALVFSKFTGGTVPLFVDRETPSGAVNGSNTTYTLAFTPISGSEHVYLNGLLQEPGAGNDYTISGVTITYLTAPISGDKIRVSYRR